MIFEGKTVEEAIEKGLSELNIAKEQAEIKVIEQAVKGLFGRIKTLATVSVEKKEEEISEVKEVANKERETSSKTADFVKKILSYLGAEVNAEVTETEEQTIIKIIAEDSSSVIGYRGEVLDAVQTIAGAMENSNRKVYKKVVVDCENYRDKREETLIILAKKLEKKATELRREVILEPMCPYERRLIHTALSSSQTVTTKSEGKEPNRYVVIVPNDKDVFSKPYNAGRNTNQKNAKKGNGRKPNSARTKKPYQSQGSVQKKKSTITFGTYLGNSLKNQDK